MAPSSLSGMAMSWMSSAGNSIVSKHFLKIFEFATLRQLVGGAFVMWSTRVKAHLT
jgi:hypothetical protein